MYAKFRYWSIVFNQSTIYNVLQPEKVPSIKDFLKMIYLPTAASK